jgi:hypothetical protein
MMFHGKEKKSIMTSENGHTLSDQPEMIMTLHFFILIATRRSQSLQAVIELSLHVPIDSEDLHQSGKY